MRLTRDLQDIRFIPSSGTLEAWDPSPSVDAFVRIGRRVSEAYSRELRARTLRAPRAQLYIFVPRVASNPNPKPVIESEYFGTGEFLPHIAVVRLPDFTSDNQNYGIHELATSALNILQMVSARLGVDMDWAPEESMLARNATADSGMVTRSESDWVSSPRGRSRAQCVWEIRNSGLGEVRLRVDDGGVIRESEPCTTFANDQTQFRRLSRSLLWSPDSRSVQLKSAWPTAPTASAPSVHLDVPPRVHHERTFEDPIRVGVDPFSIRLTDWSETVLRIDRAWKRFDDPPLRGEFADLLYNILGQQSLDLKIEESLEDLGLKLEISIDLSPESRKRRLFKRRTTIFAVLAIPKEAGLSSAGDPRLLAGALAGDLLQEIRQRYLLNP